ncbi:MAG: amino acid ABC transporter permease [Ectothiorhodospiraceae bacterium]|nr:amino acid ABC transporter permease [Chromatiales bacterium]MCP5154061.1 amino acid ABC transporter permease [Ectothiorhodospiraceae bacterium]
MLENLQQSLEAFDLALFWEYRAVLLPGLLYNFYVFFLTVGVAVGLGLVAATLRLSSNVVLRWIGTGYAELCRNTPEYITLIWIFYVPPLLLSAALDRNVSFSPLLAAVIALGLASSGYFTETFRAGISSVPRGHIEAARALGMSRSLTMWRIVLPQAVRHMLPEAMNQMVSLFKSTTLVSLIAVPDLLYQVSLVSNATSKGLPLYSGAALVYFLIIFGFATLAQRFSDPWRQRSR